MMLLHRSAFGFRVKMPPKKESSQPQSSTNSKVRYQTILSSMGWWDSEIKESLSLGLLVFRRGEVLLGGRSRSLGWRNRRWGELKDRWLKQTSKHHWLDASRRSIDMAEGTIKEEKDPPYPEAFAFINPPTPPLINLGLVWLQSKLNLLSIVEEKKKERREREREGPLQRLERKLIM